LWRKVFCTCCSSALPSSLAPFSWLPCGCGGDPVSAQPGKLPPTACQVGREAATAHPVFGPMTSARSGRPVPDVCPWPIRFHRSGRLRSSQANSRAVVIEGHHLGMRARAGRTRGRQLSTSQSRGHARLSRFHGCGVIACCVGRPAGPSRSRRGRLPAAAWALRVGRPAADRHIFGMAPSHGELLNLETADDVRPLPGDMHSQRRENQEPQPLANPSHLPLTLAAERPRKLCLVHRRAALDAAAACLGIELGIGRALGAPVRPLPAPLGRGHIPD
jgi:hypothetical protein